MLDISLYELLSGEKEEFEETIKNTLRYSSKEIKRKNKQHKQKTFIIITIILLLLFMFGYKVFNLIFYSTNGINKKEYLNLNEDFNNNFREVSIIHNNKRYAMLMLGFDNKEVLEILSTLIIDGL